jgi:hypothetical protein
VSEEIKSNQVHCKLKDKETNFKMKEFDLHFPKTGSWKQDRQARGQSKSGNIAVTTELKQMGHIGKEAYKCRI